MKLFVLNLMVRSDISVEGSKVFSKDSDGNYFEVTNEVTVENIGSIVLIARDVNDIQSLLIERVSNKIEQFEVVSEIDLSSLVLDDDNKGLIVLQQNI